MCNFIRYALIVIILMFVVFLGFWVESLGYIKTSLLSSKNEVKNFDNQCYFSGVGEIHLNSLSKVDFGKSVGAFVSHVDGNEEQGHPISGKYRVRGNFTATLPKKSYRLELKRAIPFIGMPAEKEWNLLANYQDNSYLRNAAAMCMGHLIGMSFVPKNRFSKLFINAEYQGLYNVFEAISINENRVAIASPRYSSWMLEVNYRQDKKKNL